MNKNKPIPAREVSNETLRQLREQIDVQPDAVALIAYEIWEAAGRPDGYHMEHWIAAETQFLVTEAKVRGLLKESAGEERSNRKSLATKVKGKRKQSPKAVA